MSQEKPECVYHGCKRKPLESSKDGYCIFHAGAEEKDAREFNEALRSYISEITEKHLDYNFRGFVFVGDVNFSEYYPVLELTHKHVLAKTANFREARFCKDAIFDGIDFQGHTSFWKTRFHREADFEEAVWGGPHWSDTNLPKLSYR